VVLVTDKPLAPGTVFQDELLLQSGDGVASKYLVQAEVRPDGSVGLVYHRDPKGASDGPLSLDGIPLVWRGTPEGWNVTLENGSPIKKCIDTFHGINTNCRLKATETGGFLGRRRTL
jgi:hypothetical protein